ncbi:MAG: efflux RND transporter permease subunit [Elusimicrobiota bacterium]
MKIPEFSVKHPVTGTMLILILVVLGIICFTRLGLDMMPDITYPVLAVSIGYPGVSSEDVENILTKPVEEIVATVKNVKKLKSFSQEGLASILVELEWGTNLDSAAQDIRDRIDMIKDFLPEDIEKPVVFKFDPSMMPIIVYGVTGNRDMESLRSLTKDIIKDRLEQIDGVASAMVFGGKQKEILIETDKTKLDGYRILLGELVAKLHSENLNLPGGYVEDGYKEYLLRTTGEINTLKELENLPVTVRQNVPIYLKDIAEVIDGYKEVRAVSRTNNKESVMLIVNKESGSNTVIVSDKIKKVMKDITKLLPADIQLYTVFDQSRMVKRIIKVTGSNAMGGAILAILILFLFLSDWRSTLTIALSIPLSILVTFVPLYFLGRTLNFITMIGIALGVGMLVDNAIVVIENTFRHFALGEESDAAAVTGASEVGMAITASTLTTIVVFLPLVFAKGITGKLFLSLAMAVSFSLLASLFVSLTIVPIIISRIFKPGTATSWEKKATDFLKDKYSRLLQWTLGNKGAVILSVFGILIICLLLAVFVMGKEFFPKVDFNMVLVSLKMPVGTTLQETDRVTQELENIVLNEDGVQTVLVSVGIMEGQKQDVAWGTGSAGVNEAQLFIRLHDKLDRKRSAEQILNSIRNKMPQLQNVKLEFMDMSSAMMAGGGRSQKPVQLKLFGKDINKLEQLAEQIISKIKTIKGMKDIDTTLVKGKPELQIKINREKSARLQLTAKQIASTVQTAVQGKIATRIHQAGEEIDIRVKLRPEDRKSLKDIENLSIITPQGLIIPLGEVAKLVFSYGPIRLERENQKRIVTITANITGKDLGKIINEIKKVVKKIQFPEGYFIDYAGEAEQMRETFTDLGYIFLLALLLIYMVMASEFESFIHPLVIMFTVPFSIIGVVLGLVMLGKNICLPAGMGILILAGIIVNNGIVMIDYINKLRRRGKEKIAAIIEGATTRLRPVLMTAITTMLGMMPMVFSRAEGSEARSVAASAIVGGLFVGTMLTLLVLPVVYSILDDLVKSQG